jgi:hypothetical protein
MSVTNILTSSSMFTRIVLYMHWMTGRVAAAFALRGQGVRFCRIYVAHSMKWGPIQPHICCNLSDVISRHSTQNQQ